MLLAGATGFMLAVVMLAAVMFAAATGATLLRFDKGEPMQAEAQMSAPVERPPELAPPSDPSALRPVSETDALALNAAIPVSTLPNPAATPFRPGAGHAAALARSIDCLAAAAYYEAGSEGLDGQRAVAQVVLNRVRHPAYPHSVCGVVFQGAERRTGCQFTFTCDGSLSRMPSRQGWAQAQAVAAAALAGYVYKPVGWATHYHADYVLPYWASAVTKTAVVGAHIFYRFDGFWGTPRAFAVRYTDSEPDIGWRGGFGQEPAVQQALSEEPVADAISPSIEERPVIATAGRSSPLQASGDHQRIMAISNDQRWILGGVVSNDELHARARQASSTEATQEAEAPPRKPIGS